MAATTASALLTVALLATGTGCARGGGDGPGTTRPAPGTVAPSTAPVEPGQHAGAAGDGAGSGQADSDVTDAERLLDEVDGQLAEADRATPEEN